MSQPVLRTHRLTLAPLADEHLLHERELDSDPEVMRYLTGHAATPAEVAAAHARRLDVAVRAPGLGYWAGFAGDDFVGWWLLVPPHGPDQPYGPGEAELGYRLLRRHWRHGYASEGARELIRHGFAELGLSRVFAQTMAINAGSRATMAAAGMTFARAYVSRDEYDDVVESDQDEVEYEITRAMWSSSRT